MHFLPRNDFENKAQYKLNNINIIKNIIINNGCIVLDTYYLNNSDIIIIDFGSSFWLIVHF